MAYSVMLKDVWDILCILDEDPRAKYRPLWNAELQSHFIILRVINTNELTPVWHKFNHPADSIAVFSESFSQNVRENWIINSDEGRREIEQY